MKLSPAQLHVLKRMAMGDTLLEVLVPVEPFFRTLGMVIPCKLEYWLGANGSSDKMVKVGYQTFRSLFKYNLLEKSRYKATPPTGVTQFWLTTLARQQLQGS